MQVSRLLVSNLSITEDEYNFGGSFVLSVGDKTMNANLSDLEEITKLDAIKSYFGLDEDSAGIRNHIMSEIVVKSALSSRNKEGEGYQDNLIPGISRSLDMA